MRTVELQTAYHWHCDECGEICFSLPWNAEFGPGEREEAYRKFHELDDWQPLPDGWEQFEMVTIPEIVECWNCKTRFTTVDERIEPEAGDA